MRLWAIGYGLWVSGLNSFLGAGQLPPPNRLRFGGKGSGPVLRLHKTGPDPLDAATVSCLGGGGYAVMSFF